MSLGEKTLYTDCLLVTARSPDADPINHGALLVEGNEIIEVGKNKKLQDKHPEVTRKNLSGKLVMPGLINTHIHLNMAAIRGLAEDLSLEDWLEETYQFRKTHLDEESQKLGVRLSLVESLKRGVTTIGDMSFYQHRYYPLVEKSGLRAVLYDTTMSEYLETERQDNISRFLTKSYPDRITPGAALHAPYTSNKELMNWFKKEIIKNTDVPYSIHLAETEKEKLDSKKKHGCSPTRWLEKHDFLTPRLLAVHGVWLEEKDMEILREHGVAVSHNPESNMKLGAGMAPVTELLQKDVPVGLGTDGAASNNDLDLFAEMDTAGKLQKVRHHDPRKLKARQITQMATLEGARALGLGEVTGSLQPGKKADFIAIDLQQLHLKPIYNIHSQICYSISGHDVTDSWIDGRRVVKDGKLLTMDEEKLLAEITRENRKINRQRQREAEAIRENK